MKNSITVAGNLRQRLVSISLLGILLSGCSSSPKIASDPTQPRSGSRLVEISVLTTTANSIEIPSGARIVIAEIPGPCSLELKTALAERLVDNANYEVLTRDNLEQILVEAKSNWAGDFNSETAIQLGRLLGASLFIVGRVVYCGSGQETTTSLEARQQYDIFAVLQLIDPETGRVMMSSVNEGNYVSGSEPLLFSETLVSDSSVQSSLGRTMEPASVDESSDQAEANGELRPSLADRARAMTRSLVGRAQSLVHVSRSRERLEAPDLHSEKDHINLKAFRAAENLASDFADKFFSRPTWERVEMWENSDWTYGGIVRFVKLGHCDRALEVLEREAASEVSAMPAGVVAEYLHNYGVALLCSNRPQDAMDKLHSSYRIGYEGSTLRMLSLAAKSLEWSLHVEPDREPEVEMLVDRCCPGDFAEPGESSP